MAYRIKGLDPAIFADFFAMPAEELATHRATRQIAPASAGYPCRVSLQDAEEGDDLLLIHHVSHSVQTPYRSAFAIFVRKQATEAAEYVDRCPPVFTNRSMALRGYGGGGMLTEARLVLPGSDSGSVDENIRSFLEDPKIAYIDAHNAAHGCFAARIERHDG